MQEKSKIKSVLKFAEDKGFYIILGLCIVAIGISGYVLFFTGEAVDVPDPITLSDLDTTSPPEVTRVPVTQPVTEPPVEVNKPTPPTDIPVVKPTEIPVESTTVSNPVKVPELTFVMPVKGDVSRTFSGDELVLDPTMGDWRVHRGVDIDCAKGADVVAMTAGTIRDIFTDAMYGNCISIAHENGLVSTYCGLAVNELVASGQEVKAGSVIGKAGDNILAESSQPCHIHVELTRDGAYVDPLSIIK